MLKMITPKVVSIIGILIVFLASCNSKDNLKITLPEDIKLAKSILISHGRLEAVL